jgi:hypothetical protein
MTERFTEFVQLKKEVEQVFLRVKSKKHLERKEFKSKDAG